MTSQPLLAIQSLAFERDDRLLFSDLTADVGEGDILQVAGPNGSGKTTLLRILIRSLSPLSGELLWRGIPIRKCLTEYAAGMFYLGHQSGIKITLTPEENLTWLCRLNPSRTDVTAREALARVGLAGYEDVPCYTLSAGQQRRVALARLHMTAAPLWILDEPFTAVDKAGVAELEALVQQHAERGGAVILTTHQELGIAGVQLLTLGGV